MAIFKKEDIVGYHQDQKILCIDCAKEIEDLEQEDIITTDDLEKSDYLYFCDTCGKQLA